MAEFIDAGSVDEFPPGRGTSVTVAGKDVAVFNVEGTIYAMEDSCLHQGSSRGTSELRGRVVICRGHGWRHNVTTGAVVHAPDVGLDTYPVTVVDGRIMIAVGEPPAVP